MPPETPAARAWNVYEAPADAPGDQDLEHLTHRVLGLKDATRRDVLCALREGRMSYAELEKALERNPGLIHRALKALEQDGLVIQQVNARQKPVTRSYRLAPSGAFVVDLIDRFRVAAERVPLELKTETGTYVLYSREVADKAGNRERRYFFSKKGNAVKDARPEPSPAHHRVIIPHASAPVLE